LDLFKCLWDCLCRYVFVFGRAINKKNYSGIIIIKYMDKDEIDESTPAVAESTVGVEKQVYKYDQVFEIAEALVDAVNNSHGLDEMVEYLNGYFKDRECDYPVDPFSSVSNLKLVLKTSHTLLSCEDITDGVRNLTMEALNVCAAGLLAKLEVVLTANPSFA
jgi:hypothetical protein